MFEGLTYRIALRNEQPCHARPEHRFPAGFLASSLKKSLRNPGNESRSTLFSLRWTAMGFWISLASTVAPRTADLVPRFLFPVSWFPQRSFFKEENEGNEENKQHPGKCACSLLWRLCRSTSRQSRRRVGTTLRFSNLRTDVCPPTLDLQHALAA